MNWLKSLILRFDYAGWYWPVFLLTIFIIVGQLIVGLADIFLLHRSVFIPVLTIFITLAVGILAFYSLTLVETYQYKHRDERKSR